MSKFLLLLGSSGVGKSSIIEELIRLDDRFIYISPFTTRRLRDGEKNKIFVSETEMDNMSRRGEILAINELYGAHYATPRSPIVQALAKGKFPVLDWPISQIDKMTRAFPQQLYVVYILPPSIEILERRLTRDGRDFDGRRLQSAREELAAYKSSQYAIICDFEIVAEENKVPEIARTIYANYLRAIDQHH